MKKLLATSAIALALATTGGGDAKAQAIDYGSLKELFGQPVTTSANGSPQKESEVPLNMEILTQEDIKQHGARSIPELLRFIPGLSVKSATFGQTTVGVRGYNKPGSERILVLLNGREVYKDFFGFVAWGDIPVEMAEIQQIEVVKGPNTALFGFNAVSGVVNIITYNPLYEDVGEAKFSVGNKSYTQASAVKTFKFGDKVATRLSAGGYDAEEYDDVTDHFDNTLTPAQAANNNATSNERRSFSIDTWWQVSDNVQLQFEASQSRLEASRFQATRTDSGREFDTSHVRARMLADTDYGLIEADYYHNETRVDTFFANLPGLGYVADNRVDLFKLNNTFKIGADHTFRGAFEYRDTRNVFEGLSSPGAINVSDQGGDTGREIWGVSALWDWKATDRLSTSAVVRFDHVDHYRDSNSFTTLTQNIQNAPFNLIQGFTEENIDDLTLDEVGYNFGAVYELSEKDTLRGTISRGVDLPSITEVGGEFFAQNPATSEVLLFTGNADIESAIVNNFELGYDRKLDRIDGMLRLSAYYQHNKDMQSLSGTFEDSPLLAGIPPTGVGAIQIADNIGDTEAYGFEISLEGKYRDNLDWFLGYSYIDINDDLGNFGLNPDAPTLYNNAEVFEPSVRNHNISAHLGYDWHDWRFDVFGQYINSASILNFDKQLLEDVNDQVIVNANISYDITDNLTWSVTGNSITGQTQQITEADAEREVWTSLSVKF